MAKGYDNEIHEFFKHYRASAVALSATSIAISGGLIYWLTSLLKGQPPVTSICIATLIVIQLVAYGFVVIASLFIQYFYFKGSYHFAQSIYNYVTYKMDKKEEAKKTFQSEKETSDKWFGLLDIWVTRNFIALVSSLLLTTTFYIAINFEKFSSLFR